MARKMTMQKTNTHPLQKLTTGERQKYLFVAIMYDFVMFQAQVLQLKDRAAFNSGTQILDQMLVAESLILLKV